MKAGSKLPRARSSLRSPRGSGCRVRVRARAGARERPRCRQLRLRRRPRRRPCGWLSLAHSVRSLRPLRAPRAARLVDLCEVVARDALARDQVEARVAGREVRLRDRAHRRFRDLLRVGAGVSAALALGRAASAGRWVVAASRGRLAPGRDGEGRRRRGAGRGGASGGRRRRRPAGLSAGTLPPVAAATAPRPHGRFVSASGARHEAPGGERRPHVSPAVLGRGRDQTAIPAQPPYHPRPSRHRPRPRPQCDL